MTISVVLAARYVTSWSGVRRRPASDYHTAFFTATARRPGRTLDVLLAHTLTVRSDGLWREYRVSADDQDAEYSFWS